jgi:hypothetical protein
MEISAELFIPGAKTSERILLETEEEHPQAVFGRSRKEKIRADHYDDYENIQIIQGNYHESAVTLRDAAKPGSLCYRDCIARRKIKKAWFYLKSEQGGNITVRVNGQTVGSWQGNTADYIYEKPIPMGPDAMHEEIERIKTWNPVYTAVPVEFEEKDTENTNEPFELELILEGDIRLSRFWMEG